jgi:hypothetical protein
MRELSNTNLADRILVTAKRTRDEREKKLLAPIAQALLSPSVKKVSFGPSLIELVERTQLIEPEEIIGHIKPDYLPFDQIWMEGPPFKIGDKFLGENNDRCGALITADHERKQFSFRMIAEESSAPDMKFDYERGGRRFPWHIHGGKSLTLHADITTTVCSERGILLDEDAIFHQLEKNRKFTRSYGSKVGIEAEDLSLIDVYHFAGDFFARSFLTMGSPVVPHTMNWQKSAAEVAADRKSRERLRANGEPRTMLDPIDIDLARVSPRVSFTSAKEVLRELLGITDVRRSRDIISKYGIVFNRKAHERRIAAEVDNRGKTRHLHASKMFDLQLGPTGFVRKLGEPA